MTTKLPIPDAALDDRLAFVGTSGSGKTYNAGTAVERLLDLRARVGIVDPLGVSWGLRMLADGKTASKYKIVIFGGPHSDLPLTEHAGALIGETCAAMAESFILDLSELGTKAAERRFMLHFLTALYRKTAGEPLHLVIDEADMFAPQMVADKDGEAVKLLGMMETIVRRGRIKGFIPWLITQRPAVLNKNVLSQADGLIAMKLTSSQDRTALGDWIEGQADRAEGKRILGEMPSLQLGTGVVWIPGRGILATSQFPRKRTFDSSRTPKRGEAKRTLTLKALDLGALKARLATIEAEVAANDPKALKARVAELERQLKAAPAGNAALVTIAPPSPALITAAEKRGYSQGVAEGKALGIPVGEKKGAEAAFRACQEALQAARRGYAPSEAPLAASAPAAPPARAIAATRTASAPLTPAKGPSGDLGPKGKVLSALAWWEAAGIQEPSRKQIAAIAGVVPTGSTLRGYFAALIAAGLIEYHDVGNGARLTPAGRAAAPAPDRDQLLPDFIKAQLNAQQAAVFDVLLQSGAGSATRAEIAAQLGVEEKGSTLRGYLAALSNLELIEYARDAVQLQDWVLGR